MSFLFKIRTIIVIKMKGVTVILSMLIFFLGCVHADFTTSSFNISSSQQYIDDIEASFATLNDSAIPAWVNDWKAPKTFHKLFPFYKSGYDFDGSPVYVMEFGHWKVAETIRSYEDGPEEAVDLIIKYQDQMMYSIYRDGLAKNSQGVALIVDYDGFGLSNYASPLGRKAALRKLALLVLLSKVLNHAFFINTNFAAENLLRLGRPLMGSILDKCEIFGTQKSKWLPHLARKIPTDQLPPWYGGPEDWQPVSIGLKPSNSTDVSTT